MSIHKTIYVHHFPYPIKAVDIMTNISYCILKYCFSSQYVSIPTTISENKLYNCIFDSFQI